jgi:PAS domain S-box-containing protein
MLFHETQVSKQARLVFDKLVPPILRRNSVFRALLLTLAVPFGVQSILFISYYAMLNRSELREQSQFVSKEVIGRTNWVFASLGMQTTNALLYLVTSDAKCKKDYQAGKPGVQENMSELKSRVAEITKEDLPAVEKIIKEAETLQSALDLLLQNGFHEKHEGTVPGVEIVKVSFDKIFRARHDLLARLRTAIHADYFDLGAERTVQKIGLLALFSMSLLSSVLLLFFFSRNISRRLEVMDENSRRIVADEDLLPLVEGNDEISNLDKTFHDMRDSLIEIRKRERLMLDNAADVVCSLSSDFRFLQVNASVLEAWGYHPTEVIDHSFFDFIANEDAELTKTLLEKTKSEKSKSIWQTRVLTKKSGLIDTDWSAIWSADESSYFCVGHDISQRVKLEQLKMNFIAMVSHDVRAPLSNIAAALDLLLSEKMGKLAGPQRTLLSAAKRGSSSLIYLTNDLLEMEKVAAGKFELIRKECDLKELASRALELTEQTAIGKKIGLATNGDSTIVDADPDRVIQVLTNLISNAVKFSPEASSVNVNWKTDDGFVRIEVSDQGKGVPPEKREQIFQPYAQADLSDSKRGVGIGLGLTICKSLVEQHGGKIGCAAGSPVGSIFWFTLPLAKHN